MDGTNSGPYSPPPIPIPSVARVPCQGAEQIEKKHSWSFSLVFILTMLNHNKKSIPKWLKNKYLTKDG